VLIRNSVGILSFALFAGLTTHAATGVLEIRVRDVKTHYSVAATVKLDGPKSVSAKTDDTGSLTLTLPPGEYREEVSAPGYQTMRSHTNVQSGKTSPMGFMLDPLNPPPEEQALESRIKPGFTLLDGYAV
jgi:Carboxypeptidase regulatory-like domain